MGRECIVRDAKTLRNFARCEAFGFTLYEHAKNLKPRRLRQSR